MNKADLILTIAEKSEVSKREVEKVINTFVDTVEEAVANKEKVMIMGFGTFEAVERAEKKGRNPQTNEELIIPARTVPAFKAGKEFKEMVK